MTARVLNLPRTPKGRRLMCICIACAGGWDFPDGTSADAPVDWDAAVDEIERGNAEFDAWLSGRGGAVNER